MNFKENETPTKLRGGYYTPSPLATFINRWVLEIDPQVLLEPSCGDGVFFGSLKELDYRTLSEIWAFEIDPEEARKAKEASSLLQNTKSKVFNEDFLNWFLSRPILAPFVDAVVGNPPFIRYQYLSEKQQELACSIFARFKLKFTKHTNAWVPFVVASIALLNEGGRLGMVLPSELLHVLHAESLRSFLAQSCSRMLIIDPQELWFDNTLQGAIILLAEKKFEAHQRSEGLKIISTNSRSILDENPEILFQQAKYVNGEVLRGKWMRALLTQYERDILKSAIENQLVSEFRDIAEVAVGIVTGANGFFLVPDEVVNKHDLHRWAYPMFGRSDNVPGVIYDLKTHQNNREQGKSTNFIWFEDEKYEDLPNEVREYLAQGESQKLHKRYKCRIREPWYSVPSVYATDIGMLKRSHHFPRLILNELGAFTTDTIYRVHTTHISPVTIVFNFVNSLTALTAELEGRHYGGGVLELVPSEIRKLFVPVAQADKQALLELNNLMQEDIKPDEIICKQDAIILRSIGLGKNDISTIHDAWNTLRLRRQRTD